MAPTLIALVSEQQSDESRDAPEKTPNRVWTIENLAEEQLTS